LIYFSGAQGPKGQNSHELAINYSLISFFALRAWLCHTDCTDYTDFFFALRAQKGCHTESTENTEIFKIIYGYMKNK